MVIFLFCDEESGLPQEGQCQFLLISAHIAGCWLLAAGSNFRPVVAFHCSQTPNRDDAIVNGL